MSLYNAIFGVNPTAPSILELLDLAESDVPRFRDCSIVERDNEKRPVIALRTRMGGGNRGHWETMVDSEPGSECECPGCRAEYVLKAHPLYLYDEDDDFDCTYATYFFALPDGVEVPVGVTADTSISDRFQALTKAMDEGLDTPDTRRATEVGKQLAGVIKGLKHD